SGGHRGDENAERRLIDIDSAESAALEPQPQRPLVCSRKSRDTRIDLGPDMKLGDIERGYHRPRSLPAPDGDPHHAVCDETARELAEKLLDGDCHGFASEPRLRLGDAGRL